MTGILLYGAGFPAGENARAAARALLAHALLDAWGWSETPPMARGKWGKPCFPSQPSRHFNLSHTAGLCLCALSDAGEVGVDIEAVRPRQEGLPRRAMSEGELAAFDGTWEDFYRIWTLKEAYCKFQGRSIFPPRSVPAPPPVPWRSYAGEGWRAALCGDGTAALPGEILWLRGRGHSRQG